MFREKERELPYPVDVASVWEEEGGGRAVTLESPALDCRQLEGAPGGSVLKAAKEREEGLLLINSINSPTKSHRNLKHCDSNLRNVISLKNNVISLKLCYRSSQTFTKHVSIFPCQHRCLFAVLTSSPHPLPRHQTSLILLRGLKLASWLKLVGSKHAKRAHTFALVVYFSCAEEVLSPTKTH